MTQLALFLPPWGEQLSIAFGPSNEVANPVPKPEAPQLTPTNPKGPTMPTNPRRPGRLARRLETVFRFIERRYPTRPERTVGPYVTAQDWKVIRLALEDRERDMLARGSEPAAIAARLVRQKIAPELSEDAAARLLADIRDAG